MLNFLRLYSNFLFSFLVVFPLLILGTKTDVFATVFIVGTLVIGSLFFRNYRISAFYALFFLPLLFFIRHILNPIGFIGFFVALCTAIMCYWMHRLAREDRFPDWIWYLVLYAWFFWFFYDGSKDILKFIILLGIIFFIIRMLSLFNWSNDITTPQARRVIHLLCLFMLGEVIWVLEFLPLSYIFSPLFLLLSLYTLILLGEYHLEKKHALRYYIFPLAFTFASMLVILLIATRKPF